MQGEPCQSGWFKCFAGHWCNNCLPELLPLFSCAWFHILPSARVCSCGVLRAVCGNGAKDIRRLHSKPGVNYPAAKSLSLLKKKKPGGSARVHYKCSVQKKWVVMVQPVIKMVIQAMNSGNFTAKFKHSSE